MKTIVIGALNTDLIATGIEQFPKAGEHVYGKELIIGPGGKSRNIADMIAHLAPKDTVAMVGRTVRDPYGFWKAPLDALTKVSVNTDYVTILDFEEVNKLPGIAIINVDVNGDNQIVALPGVSDDFNKTDIDKAMPLFEIAGKNTGVLVATLECPPETAAYAIEIARHNNLKVMLDPGGVRAGVNLAQMIGAGIYLIKPNEHEAKILTGIEVTDFGSAKQAAQKLQKQGAENVLITAGAQGAYLFTRAEQTHIAIPQGISGDEKDATGCGDQTMAALCAYIQEGKSLEEAAELAILAGTLQFHRTGINPVTKEQLNF